MAYRKITIDGTTYEYVVGKTHVKVKGVGIWRRDEVGHEVDGKRNKYVVSPSIMRSLITGDDEEQIYTCKHTATTSWAYDPFAIEIHGMKVKVANCPICLQQSADDI